MYSFFLFLYYFDELSTLHLTVLIMHFKKEGIITSWAG
jgi:hypothetical protein